MLNKIYWILYSPSIAYNKFIINYLSKDILIKFNLLIVCYVNYIHINNNLSNNLITYNYIKLFLYFLSLFLYYYNSWYYYKINWKYLKMDSND